MTHTTRLSSLVMLLCLCAPLFFGCQNTDPAPAKSKAVSTADDRHAAIAEAGIFNRVCPISGQGVNPKGNTVEHDGKKIGFCCNGCDDKFKANPEAYMAKLSQDGTSFVGEAEPMH